MCCISFNFPNEILRGKIKVSKERVIKKEKKKTCRSAVIAEAYCACCFLLTPGKCRSPPHYPISHQRFIGATTQHAETWRTLSVLSSGVGDRRPALPMHSSTVLEQDFTAGPGLHATSLCCSWTTP